MIWTSTLTSPTRGHWNPPGSRWPKWASLSKGRAAGSAAIDADLLPGTSDDDQSFTDIPLTVNWLEDNWFNLSELGNTVPVINRRPSAMRFPNGVDKPVRSWRVFYTSVVEWLEEAGHLSAENIPTEISNLLHHYSGESSRELKNGRFINVNLNADAIIGNIRRFVEACREDPGQFHVQLR